MKPLFLQDMQKVALRVFTKSFIHLKVQSLNNRNQDYLHRNRYKTNLYINWYKNTKIVVLVTVKLNYF